MHCLVAEFRKRMGAYSAVHKLIGFLTEFESLTLETHLVESYPEDLEPAFVDEFVLCTDILVSDNNKTVSRMSELLKKHGGIMLSTFPNVATNISDTSHKQLKARYHYQHLKSHLRNTMGQERLAALSLLCIKSDVRELDCTEL